MYLIITIKINGIAPVNLSYFYCFVDQRILLTIQGEDRNKGPVYEKSCLCILKSTENVEIFATNLLVYNCRHNDGDRSCVETSKICFFLLGKF